MNQCPRPDELGGTIDIRMVNYLTIDVDWRPLQAFRDTWPLCASRRLLRLPTLQCRSIRQESKSFGVGLDELNCYKSYLDQQSADSGSCTPL